MKKISKEKLVAALKIIYSAWNREHEDEFPSKYYFELEAGVPYEFYKKIEKSLGLGKSYDDFYYWMNALEENEDNLDNGTLTVDNVVVPTWNTFDIDTFEDRNEQVTVYYEGRVEGYFNEEQINRSFYELGNGGAGSAFDIYDFNESDRVYGDGSGNGIELKDITLVDSTIPESVKRKKVIKESSLDSFVDSLTEEEAKFLMTKLQKKFL